MPAMARTQPSRRSLWHPPLEETGLEVESCHRLGILHEDLKGENTLLLRDARPRACWVALICFGEGVAFLSEPTCLAGTSSRRSWPTSGQLGYEAQVAHT